ncbi:hypothetical protein Tco_0606353 [Tanacetum coccineum]
MQSKRSEIKGSEELQNSSYKQLWKEIKKVNYADSHCIIISHKNSTEEDINLLNQFGLPFLKNTIEAKGTTKEAYCRQARQMFEEHSCTYCVESKDKEVGPSTSPIMAVPTTEDESSSD